MPEKMLPGKSLQDTKLQKQSAMLAQGARNEVLSRNVARDLPKSSKVGACASGSANCEREGRICLAQSKCETPPTDEERPSDCNLKTIAVIDDHPLFRAGVVQALMEASCFDVIAEGASKADAIAIVKQHSPDLIVLDVSIPGGGIEAASEIRMASPATKLLFLTVSDAESDVLACLQAGALGYVLKGLSGSDLVNMANAVFRGETIVTPSLAGRLLTSMHKRKDNKTTTYRDNLTPREEEILEWVTQGKTNKEVARALDLTEKTVKHYMTNIMLKLGVRNRVEAALVRSPR
jgi:two-component system nitrate/nitrite response regulator NarL